jgi:hypothetical protein
LELVCKLENFSEIQEARQLIDIRQEYELRNNSEVFVKPLKDRIELPESFCPIWDRDGSLIQKAAERYITKKRKLDIKRAMYAGVGYCSSGPYGGYIIFPIYLGGELVFYQGRLFMGNGPKMNNPKFEEFGVGKTEILYNQDALYIYDKVYIVESIINALTIGDTAVATLGKSYSPYQLTQLLKSPCESFVIILDPDAYDKAIDLALVLVHYKRVKVINWNGDKDVNDLGRKEVMQRVKAQPYQSYRDLFNIKLNLKK